MKKFVLSLIICSICLVGLSQKKKRIHIKEYFSESATIGTSMSYTWQSDAYFGDHFYQEYSWNINTAMRLSKRFWIGGHFNPIFTWQKLNEERNQANYFFGGVFLKYDLIQIDQFTLFFEGGINTTNYCTCGDYNDPYLEKNLLTWSLGSGMEFLLNSKKKSNLWLELAFKNYTLFNAQEEDYAFDQYVVGLRYRLGRLN